MKGQTTVAEEVLIEAINDGCERLLLPSVENEIRSDLSEKAHNSSIEVFSMNLEKLLNLNLLKLVNQWTLMIYLKEILMF